MHFKECVRECSVMSGVWVWTLWTIAHKAPLSMGFCRQEYWRGLPSPPPESLPYQGIKPASSVPPARQVDSLATKPPGRPILKYQLSSVQSLSHICDPMDYSMPGFSVHHQLSKLTQTHAHRVGDAIQSPHPLSSLSPPAFNISQHQGLFKWVRGGQSIGASAPASVLPMNIQGWFPLGLTSLISLWSRDSQESSPAPQFESINFSSLSLLYGSALTFIHDYWKNHSFDYTGFCLICYLGLA